MGSPPVEPIRDLGACWQGPGYSAPPVHLSESTLEPPIAPRVNGDLIVRGGLAKVLGIKLPDEADLPLLPEDREKRAVVAAAALAEIRRTLGK